MRVSLNKNEENEKLQLEETIHKIRPLYESFYGRKRRKRKNSTKGSSTIYDHFMRVSMDKNEESEKIP